MKKAISLGMMVLIFLLSACGTGDNWKVEFTDPPKFNNGDESTFEIKVTEEGKPVTGLNATASMEMTKMSHGSINVKLEEAKDGLYKGKAALTMAGDYTVAFKFKKDGYTVEKVLEVEAVDEDGDASKTGAADDTSADAGDKGAAGDKTAVATINGEPINAEDIEFYRFINNLHIAINREADKQSYKGAELNEKMSYWDSQEKLNDNNNTLLTQIIRLRAMAMLAEEKGHKASKEEVDKEINSIRGKYNQSPVAVKLIKEFGEKRFWEIEQKQYEMIVLTKKVQNDIVEQVKKENPSVSEQEISFLAQKKYEELLVSQVNSLKVEVL